jgi:hypothetical protein
MPPRQASAATPRELQGLARSPIKSRKIGWASPKATSIRVQWRRRQAANVAKSAPSERHPLDVGADAVARHVRIEDECAQAQRLKVMPEPDRGG